jgi:Glycosyltransferases, probably involved in cell wall biogenesis
LSPFIITAYIILGIQVLFLLLFLFAFLRAKPKAAQPAVPVSIIICAHDEEKNLKELIPQLLSQDYPDFEVIVVEDRSNDGTFDYLLHATKEFPKLKMVRVTHKPEHIHGKKFALTLGIKAAQFDWVLLTDADCRPTGDQWIKEMMGNRDEKTEIILGFSPYEKIPGLLNSFIRFESFLTGIQFMGLALLGKPYMGVGRNLAYKRSLFLNNKGFNAHLGVTGGDDDLFVNQHTTINNTAVSMGSASVTISQPKKTWKEFFVQKLRHLSAGKRYKLTDRLMLGAFALTWLFVWFWAAPIAIMSAFPVGLSALFLVRWMIMIGLFQIAPQKLGGSFEGWKTPFLDFIYAFYYLVTGLRALVVKKVKWKI